MTAATAILLFFFIQKYFWKFHHLPIPGSIQQYLHTTGDENKKILLQKLTENYQKNYFPKKGQVQHVCKSRYFKKVLWKWSLLSNLQFQTSQFVTIVRSRKSKYKPSYSSSKATCFFLSTRSWKQLESKCQTKFTGRLQDYLGPNHWPKLSLWG